MNTTAVDGALIQKEIKRRTALVNWEKGACQDDYEWASMTGIYASDRDGIRPCRYYRYCGNAATTGDLCGRCAHEALA